MFLAALPYPFPVGEIDGWPSGILPKQYLMLLVISSLIFHARVHCTWNLSVKNTVIFSTLMTGGFQLCFVLNPFPLEH